MHAVEGAHFFAQPIFIPFIYRYNAFCMSGNFAAKECHSKAGRFTPQAP
jgi:phosphopantetheinyl transferase (holo-ACP synthase)